MDGLRGLPRPKRLYRSFTAIVGVFGGAVVAGIFQAIAGTKAALPREVWFYPVGLLAGVLASATIDGLRGMLARRSRELEETRQAEAEKKKEAWESRKNVLATYLREQKDHVASFPTIGADLGFSYMSHAYDLVERYPDIFCRRRYGDLQGVGLVDKKSLPLT